MALSFARKAARKYDRTRCQCLLVIGAASAGSPAALAALAKLDVFDREDAISSPRPADQDAAFQEAMRAHHPMLGR